MNSAVKFERDFYLQDTFDVAKRLLGSLLCTQIDGVFSSGKIVELEPYIGGIDKASHSYMGKRTARTEVQFGPGGYAYIFLVYGMHSQFCVVTGQAGISDVILIRSVEPIDGVDAMQDRRKTNRLQDLTNGPGRLCEALGITRELYGEDLCGDRVWLSPGEDHIDQIICAKRIGIDYAGEFALKPWRFYLAGNEYVSKKDAAGVPLSQVAADAFDTHKDEPIANIERVSAVPEYGDVQEGRRLIDIISWNVNGIRAACQKGFLEWLNRTSPDVLALQEVRAASSQIPRELSALNTYHLIWNGGSKGGYSGTAVFSKETPISIQMGLGIDEFDEEGRTIVVEYTDFVLINCYFPNGGRDLSRLQFKLDFCDAFLTKCELIRSRGKPLIFCGDVNTAHREIDLANPKSNEKKTGFLKVERAWIDKIVELGYVDSFRHFFPTQRHRYTWWSNLARSRERNVGWRLDYVFASGESVKRLKGAYILDGVMGSDHCPVGVKFEVDSSLGVGKPSYEQLTQHPTQLSFFD